MTMKILVVDDEPRIVRGVRNYFEDAGYSVVTALDGPSALEKARREHPDLIVLDLMLPGMDGFDVCRTLRQESDVPIIMLTARVEETDQLIGLELGADDYVTKPFSPRMLVARARAVLRRAKAASSSEAAPVYRAGDLELDVGARRCQVAGEEVPLTPTEFDLLHALMRRPGRVFSRMQLLEASNLGAYDGVERTIDVHIHNLRQKIESDPSEPRYILTVFGVGYRFNDDV
jgi:DNA-binding response OmpR family regulator